MKLTRADRASLKWKNPSMASAFWKGYRHGVQGGAVETCPYQDVRSNHKNSVTFSKAFRNAWLDGFKEGKDASKC